jgi:NADH:ubiquinone oxidoreductase subunit H
VACLAAILFFGGWLSPIPPVPALAWTRYLPTALFAAAGVALVIHGVRYITALGRVVLPVWGLVMCALAFICSRPGVIDVVQGPFWFLMKVFIVLFVYVWVRWTLPRFRYDQLMAIGWKLLLPLTIANVVLTSLAVVARK